jgi:hypothetical protein
MTQCQNCDTSFEGGYCPNCGQKNVDLKRPLIKLVKELLRETFEVDGRTIRTFRTMILQPGVLTSEFLNGRRRTYTSPLRLYLVISVVFFLFGAWIAQQGLLLDPGQTVEQNAAEQARFMSDALPRLMFLLLPVFALLLKLAIWRRLYFDHVIFSIHLHSIVYVTLAVMLPFENMTHWLPLLIQVALLVYIVRYLLISVRHVYQLKWPAAVAKSFVVLIAYLGLISAVIEGVTNWQILSD